MSLFGIFNIGKSAVFASQTALATISHNIANVNTPGFSRQEAVLEISQPTVVSGGYMGMGVTVSGIRRSYDSFIQLQLTSQNMSRGSSYIVEKNMSMLETVFNETTSDGFAQALSDYFNAWQDVAANPEGYTQRNVLLQKANSLVLTAKNMESSITSAINNINKEMDNVTERINTIAADIADLNYRIVQAEGGVDVGTSSDLRDQRDELLNNLADLTEISYYEDQTGAVNITMGMRSLVSGKMTKPVSTQINNLGEKEIYLDGIDITSSITKGQLGGLIASRDSILAGPLADLRRLVASVTNEVNLLHNSGFGLDASTGNDFFNPLQLSTLDGSVGANMTATITDYSQLTLDEYTVSFDATAANYQVTNNRTGAAAAAGAYVAAGTTINFDGIRLVISGAALASDTFSVSPLTYAITNFGVAVSDINEIAASSTNVGLSGNNLNALAMADLANTGISGIGDMSFSEYYQRIVSAVGLMSREATDSLKFNDTMLNVIQNRRESASGVNLDEEAANLIRFQRSYEAGARLLRVADELFETILNI